MRMPGCPPVRMGLGDEAQPLSPGGSFVWLKALQGTRCLSSVGTPHLAAPQGEPLLPVAPHPSPCRGEAAPAAHQVTPSWAPCVGHDSETHLPLPCCLSEGSLCLRWALNYKPATKGTEDSKPDPSTLPQSLLPWQCPCPTAGCALGQHMVTQSGDTGTCEQMPQSVTAAPVLAARLPLDISCPAG